MARILAVLAQAHDHARDSGGPHEHAPGSAAHTGEAFPRHATAELVAAALAEREKRERWQAPLVVLGLVLLVLAFPASGLFGQTLDFVARAADGAVASSALLPSVIALVLGRLTSLGTEPILFALSACAFGSAALPLLALARERGWERAPALAAVLVALCAPVALVAATLASPAAFALLGGAVFFAALHRKACTSRSRAAAWVLASALHAQLVWTWPALLAPAPGDDGDDDTAPSAASRWLAAGAALVAFAALFVAAHAGARDFAGAARALVRELVAGGSGGPGPCLAWWTLWLPALGASGIGLALLGVQLARARAWRREFALVLYVLTPLAAFSLGGALDWEIPYLWLVPPGVLGLLELFQLAGERGRSALARLACVPLAAYGVAAACWLRGLDTHAAWTAQASELLNPGDVVLTASAEHRHLLVHRFHVEARGVRRTDRADRPEAERFWIEQTELARTLSSSGRRLVLDDESLAATRVLGWGSESVERLLRDAPIVRLPPISAGAR